MHHMLASPHFFLFFIDMTRPSILAAGLLSDDPAVAAAAVNDLPALIAAAEGGDVVDEVSEMERDRGCGGGPRMRGPALSLMLSLFLHAHTRLSHQAWAACMFLAWCPQIERETNRALTQSFFFSPSFY